MTQSHYQSHSDTNATMRVMPREIRLMAERILSLTSLPKGFFLTVGDMPMYSQKLRLGGLSLFEQRFESFCAADPARIAIAVESGERMVIDAAGQHAWFVIPSVIDLLGELVNRFGMAEITVAGANDPDELLLAASLGGRCGLAISVSGNVLTAVPATVTGEVGKDDPVLWALLQDGADVPVDLWWRIYHLAKKALATDSIVSRRHAGPMIVNEDGTIIGRKDNDDETDVTFLSSNISERMKEKAAS